MNIIINYIKRYMANRAISRKLLEIDREHTRKWSWCEPTFSNSLHEWKEILEGYGKHLKRKAHHAKTHKEINEKRHGV